MKKNYILTGWAEKPRISNALKGQFLLYQRHPNYQEFSSKIKKQKCDKLIGWSLGAQIAIRLVSENIIKPRILILIAPPFQFVSSKKHPHGINKIAFRRFEARLQNSPEQALFDFAKLSGALRTLYIDIVNILIWYPWLKELGNFSCKEINFSKFPKTLIIHGDKDAIINCEQSKILKKLIPNSELHIFKNCGHSPHTQNKKKAISLLKQ